jgi:hypothetical protein
MWVSESLIIVLRLTQSLYSPEIKDQKLRDEKQNSTTQSKVRAGWGKGMERDGCFDQRIRS